jgi:hypothetical protein
MVIATSVEVTWFDKDFEIHFNAFDFSIGGVLMQDGRLVAFESKKKMWAMIHCFKTWGHYIGSKDVVL